MQLSTQQDGAVGVERLRGVPGGGQTDQRLGRPQAASLDEYKVIRRNGAVVGFEPSKIVVAMSKAFIAVRGGQGAASAAIREQVEALTSSIVGALLRHQPAGGSFHIEDIQDQVELSLMRAGAHDVARAYVLYRERRAQQRARRRDERQAAPAELNVVDGERRFLLDRTALRDLIQASCDGLDAAVSADAVLGETLKNLYDGVPLAEVHKSAILAARALVETDPDYGRLSARLLLHSIRREVLGEEADQASMSRRYPDYFPRCIQLGIDAGRLDQRLARFDLDRLARALQPQRDLQFTYLGLQTLYDRYFLHHDGRRFELPQTFFMRVAMGLSSNEMDPDPFQLGNLPPATLVVLPDHGRGRPGLDLRGHQGKRDAGQVRRGPWQRLDPGASARLAYTRHQRQITRRRAIPESGQRHGGRGQPGRQAQGGRVLLPGGLAPGHRGVPRVAQEHRR